MNRRISTRRLQLQNKKRSSFFDARKARFSNNRRLQFEPLEDRRLVAIVNYPAATALLSFRAHPGRAEHDPGPPPAPNGARLGVLRS